MKIPGSKGHEQTGIRPAIIFSEEVSNMIIVIPLTSKMKSLNYEYTLKINPSKKNKLKLNSIALIFHLKSIDKKRVKEKIGELEKSSINDINKQIIKMLKLK